MKFAQIPLPIGLVAGAWATFTPQPIANALALRYLLIAVLFWWCVEGYRRGHLNRSISDLHRKPIVVSWGELCCMAVASVGLWRLMLA